METFVLLIELIDLRAKSISNWTAANNEILVDTGRPGMRKFGFLHIGIICWLSLK